MRAWASLWLAWLCLVSGAHAQDLPAVREGENVSLPYLGLAVTKPEGWTVSGAATLDAMNVQRNTNYITQPDVLYEAAMLDAQGQRVLRIAYEKTDAWPDAEAYLAAFMRDLADMLIQLGTTATMEPAKAALGGQAFTGMTVRVEAYQWTYLVRQAADGFYTVHCMHPTDAEGAVEEMLACFTPWPDGAGV